MNQFFWEKQKLHFHIHPNCNSNLSIHRRNWHNYISVLARNCLLHLGENNLHENIVPFTIAALENCREKKALRDRTKTKSSKFDEIILPFQVEETFGYHPSCYKSYCGVREKRRKISPVQCENLLSDSKWEFFMNFTS